MKKCIPILFFLFFVLAWGAVDADAEISIKVGVYENMPLTYLDNQGVPKGVFIEILEHIAMEEQWKIEYVPATWSQCLQNLREGGVDLLGVIAYSEQRARSFDYMLENVLTEWAQIYVHKNAKIESILDLEGKKVAVLKDDMHFYNLRELVSQSGINCRFIEAFEYEDVLRLTEIGKCDAGLVSHFYGNLKDRYFDIKTTPIILSPQKLYFAAPKEKNRQLLYTLDQHLRKLKNDETSIYYQIINKYFGVGAKSALGKWFVWVLLITGALLLLFISVTVLFRAQVKAKTRELSEKNKELVAEIDHRKQEEKKRAELEAKLQRAEKMEALGTLAGGVAHDLNNILSGLVSYPELLLLDLTNDSPLQKPITAIKNSGERAAAIVQDLLTLARRGIAVTEVVNINYIISEYIKSPEFENLKAVHPKVKLQLKLDPTLLNILGSPVHLVKTVMNLLSNAAEAMPNGGSIIIITENRYIDSPVRGYDDVTEGDYVTLTISDTGTGISSRDVDKIFEPFYTKKAMGRSGSGLGMAVVWGTVKDHKGYIDVISHHRRGTVFTLYFPVTRQGLGKEDMPLSIEDYMGNKETILIVDDVEDQREIATSILERLNYSVTSVSSGKRAVEYVKRHEVDLLVLDMIMEPGIDGLETYERIIAFNPGQKAIIASGFSETDRVRKAQQLGAGPYVKKPYTLEKIGLAIKSELEPERNITRKTG